MKGVPKHSGSSYYDYFNACLDTSKKSLKNKHLEEYHYPKVHSFSLN